MELIRSLFNGEMESPETFLRGTRDGEELDVHGKEKAMKSLKLKVIEVVKSV